MSKNQQAQAVAIRRAVAKSKKVKDLGITPELTTKERDTIVLKLSEHKAAEEGKDLKDFIKGQEWYVKDLQAFASLGGEQGANESDEDFSKRQAQARFDYEYAQAFPEVASEEEGVDAILAAI